MIGIRKKKTHNCTDEGTLTLKKKQIRLRLRKTGTACFLSHMKQRGIKGPEVNERLLRKRKRFRVRRSGQWRAMGG